MLSWALKKYGMRKTLAFGVIAWPIRYIIFAIGGPAWLVIASLTLHGFCYVFFFVAAFIYVDKVAPADIRASAQSMIAIVALGLGRFLGSLFAGAGGVAMAATAMALHKQTIPPAVNCENPDEACGLTIPCRPAQAELRHALCTAFSVGGQSAAVVLRRWEP